MNQTAIRQVETEDRYPSRTGREPAVLPRLDPIVHGTPEDGPLAAETLAGYDERGFLIQKGLLSAAEVEAVLSELDRMKREGDPGHDESIVVEPGSGAVRSIFAVHDKSALVARLIRDPRILGPVRQILGGDVYVHQSRINYKPGFRGRDFYWHSDFETWHVEDGMPHMRALSCSISLTPNNHLNGPLMLIPGSHRQYLTCAGRTPDNHYKQSLRAQEYGTPEEAVLAELVEKNGIEMSLGPAGTATFFDCNTMHGSNSNISPWPRANLFIVFNSVENAVVDPYCGLEPRPEFIATRRRFEPVRPLA